MKRRTADCIAVLLGILLMFAGIFLAWPGVLFCLGYAWLRDWEVDNTADVLLMLCVGVTLATLWMVSMCFWLSQKYG